MAKLTRIDKDNKTKVSYVTDQHVNLGSSGDELRKGVNVLPTSDPKNPAPNPFVQGQVKVSNPASNSNGKNDKKQSE